MTKEEEATKELVAMMGLKKTLSAVVEGDLFLFCESFYDLVGLMMVVLYFDIDWHLQVFVKEDAYRQSSLVVLEYY